MTSSSTHALTTFAWWTLAIKATLSSHLTYENLKASHCHHHLKLIK